MSGGYGGLYSLEPLTADVNPDDLPVDERDDLVGLATAAMAYVAASDPPGVVPDLITYRLSITGGDEWDVTLDDRTVAPEVWPLIEYMRTAALNNRMGQQ